MDKILTYRDYAEEYCNSKIEQIKNTVIQQVHHSDQLDLKVNWSDLLKEHLHYEYNYLSSLFSSVDLLYLDNNELLSTFKI